MLVLHLAHFLQDQSGDWCIYQALESEINLNQLLPKVPSVTWVYPRVINGHLRYFEPRKGFEKAFAGILEPVVEEAREISVQEISGFLVPGLGFDHRGVRLGKGKGYYDKALQNFTGTTVGVSFSSLIVDELPRDSWDVPMQWIATEEGIKKVV
jgi:5-formyltetrahydrofolate cyclo-ligase